MKPHRTAINTEKVITAAFFAGSLILYCFLYSNHLSAREQNQLFEFSPGYLAAALSRAGGFSDYAGEFLVQFFSIPMMGGIIITCLLGGLLIVLRKTIPFYTAIKSGLFSALLPSALSMVLLLDDFYCISGPAGLLISLTILLFYLKINQPAKRFISGLLLIPVVYWLTGGAYALFLCMIVLFEFSGSNRGISIYLFSSIYILISVLFPLLARHYLFSDTLLQTFLSASYYRLSIFLPVPLIILFASVPFVLLTELLKKTRPGLMAAQNIFTGILVMTTIIGGIILFGDFRSERTLKYENLVYRDKWNDIIKLSGKKPPEGKIPVAATDLALAIRSELPERMFTFSQKPGSLFIGYERKGTTPFIASDICFNLGLFNFAQMFAFETMESTADAKLPSRSVKRLAQTYLINGSYDIAGKYLSLLANTAFYRKWARQYLDKIANGEIEKDSWLISQRKMMPAYDFYYDHTKPDMALKYLIASNNENKVAYEYLMAWYLLNKDLDGFLAGLGLAEKFGYNSLPASWQEASAYIRTRMDPAPAVLARYEINDRIVKNLQAYATHFNGREDSIALRKDFGNTYWYYLHFR